MSGADGGSCCNGRRADMVGALVLGAGQRLSPYPQRDIGRCVFALAFAFFAAALCSAFSAICAHAQQSADRQSLSTPLARKPAIP